jgi:hypothetical protein
MSNLAPRRIEIANTIDEYDALIREHNESKADTFTCYRADLEKEGLPKAAIKAELAALKAAIRKRQKAAKDEQAVEDKDALTDEIYEQLKAGKLDATRTRHARGAQ